MIDKLTNTVSDLFNKVWDFTKNSFKKLLKLISTINITGININGFAKKPSKYIFYTLTVVLPLLSYFLITEMKGYTILLLSFGTFLKYLNLCIFENLCVIKNKEKCDYTMENLYDGLLIGLCTFIGLFLFKKFYDVFRVYICK